MLDLSKLYSNNIHAMADSYGIEAACKVIIKVLYHHTVHRCYYARVHCMYVCVCV